MSVWLSGTISLKMFFYLSFLKPPPLVSALSSPIYITPQIANDLRTELFPSSQDIFFSWSQVAHNASSPATLSSTTRPTKLTTWHPEKSAYKEISVPLPPNLRSGQQWRLILSASDLPTHEVYTVNFREQNSFSQGLKWGGTFGSMPFSVVSMPILFQPSTNKKGAKQEQIERFYDLGLPLESSLALMKVTEQTSYDLDKVSVQLILIFCFTVYIF